MTRKNTPSAVQSLVLSAALFTGLSAQAQPAPIYRNDFAVRLSAGPAAAKSYMQPYLTGMLCSTNGYAAYSDTSAIQDGWVEGLNNNDAIARVLDTGGNPLACLCRDVYGKYAYVRHPIGNVLTNGLVRYSGDIRPPRRWSGSSRNICLHLGYDRLMSLNGTDSEEYYKHQALLIGFRSFAATDTDFQFYAYQGNGDGSGAGMSGTAAVDTTHWYRFVALLDLNANTYTVAVYDMGTDQPVLDAALPASPVETFGGTTFRFRMDLSDATGGLTTLALSAYGVMGGDDASTDITLTARYDNLVIASKPTGAPDFTRVYANDFATRTITRTVPDPLEVGYANDTVVPNGSLTYSSGQKLTLDKTLEFPNGSILGSGTDGWVRRNSGGSKITIGSDGNAYARAWHEVGTTFITACQRIGNTVTNGTVQVTVEITPPNQWYWTTSRSVFLMIGDDSLYRGEKFESITNSYYHHYAARVGFGGTGSTDIRFVTFDGNGANNATSVYGTASVNPANWYRFIATLDLTNATFAVDVYDMGTQHSINTPTPETPVQSFAGGFRRRIGDNTLTELQGISAICLGAYGVQGGYAGTNNIPGTAGFDNIILTATLPDAEPVEIYRNPFSTRTYTNITGAARHTPLTGAIDTLGGSQDGWVRRYNGNLPGDVTADGGNPHLRLSHTVAGHAYFMQALGADITRNVLLAQYDMKPPAYWVWNYHEAALYLGDDRFWQGNRNATLSFGNYYALNFGFGSTSETASADWGVYLNTSIFASDGDGAGGSSNVFAATSIDTSHWYRFKAEIVPIANTYSLKVYDMGTAQPTLETPTPDAPVAVFDGLRFKTNMRKPGDPEERLEALSAFSVAGFGIRGSQLFPPEEQALVDNLLFSVKRTGTMIGIR